MRSPYTLERNDVDAALELYRAAKAEEVPPAKLEELTHVLLLLQDDPAALRKKLDAEA